MNALTLGTSAIRLHDGLYSLNDLHSAAGGEAKHKPANFMRLDTTQALSEEIRCSDMSITPSRVIKGKRADGTPQGTYVCRELVYAYAMWISAKFHLMVIRAFDALQQAGGFRPDVTRQALPLGLTLEQCDAVKAVHKSRVTALAAEHQAKAAIKLWSAVKSKFGVSYKEVPPEHFADVLSLMARTPLEGELLDPEPAPAERYIDLTRHAEVRRILYLICRTTYFESSAAHNFWSAMRKIGGGATATSFPESRACPWP